MRKFLFILLLLPFIAKAQKGYEDFYSEKDLLSNLKMAKTTSRQLDAAGSLAVYYKKIFKDSLAAIYNKKVFAIAENSNDVLLKANALWWDNYYEESIPKANKLMDYAEKHNLVIEKIAAYLCLIDINIHQELSAADKHCITAQSLLDSWKKDTTGKDSVRLEAYRRFAHTYLHIKNGIKTSQYLQTLQEYALHNVDEALRIQAVEILAEMYSEWDGQQKKAIPWLEKAYEYYKRKKQPHKLFYVLWGLSKIHSLYEQKEEAKFYIKEFERLEDSLEAYGFFQFWKLGHKEYLGLITPEEYIQTLDGNFNNTLVLPPKRMATTKAEFYQSRQQWDSVKVYLLLAKSLGEENKENWATYYWQKKDYEYLTPLLKELVNEDEKKGNLRNVLRWNSRLSFIYKSKEDYKTAYEYLMKYRVLKDSLERLRSEETVAEMEMQKQVEIQKATFDEQKKIQEAEQESLALKNKTRFLSLLGGVAILLLIAGILWRNNRRKQKDKLKIEQAYQELQSAQQQLILSEKMASLGELTAGIAHEIQNPLNFVNNFSDVNTELIDEMKAELKSGRTDDAISLAENIKQNNEKISHHGKRADSIVKGMLQHSRNNSGQKELTDINMLAEECMRLSYHGLRAKDKTFNAKTETEFDSNLPKINIAPQDIGRVILNLFTNAFYSVMQKKKLVGDNFEPAVMVKTGKTNRGIAITIRDNGNGVPQKIIEKIFQPFFTTKPVGEGTGLGLSLSYDIITKGHGGDLKVETKEGEFASFTIILPI